MTFDRRDIPGFAGSSIVKIDNRAFAFLDALDHRGNAIGSLCSDHHIHGGRCLEDRVAFKLSNATHYSNEWLSIAGCANFTDAREDFAFSALAYRASVEQDYICVLFGFGNVVAC